MDTHACCNCTMLVVSSCQQFIHTNLERAHAGTLAPERHLQTLKDACLGWARSQASRCVGVGWTRLRLNLFAGGYVANKPSFETNDACTIIHNSRQHHYTWLSKCLCSHVLVYGCCRTNGTLTCTNQVAECSTGS